ncbi:MAG: glycosyltransferase family 39 protein [Anaerolineales bacterium]|nr:glycosyltransferase family 39 protein [Anaerolineales bacterium]
MLCLAAFIVSATVAHHVFEGMPHLEDEHAYYFQAQVFARGEIAAPAPPSKDSFFIPFVIVRDGLWFGKYTPGFSLVLALGVLAGAPWLVNAFASALALLGVFLLGRDLFDADTGLLAAALGAVSPAFVILSGTMLPHPVTIAALVFFAWGFLRARRTDPRHPGACPRARPPSDEHRRFSDAKHSRVGKASRLASVFLSRDGCGEGMILAGTGHPASLRSVFGHVTPACFWPGFSGAMLGLSVLCRPWTAFAVAVPFIGIALIDLVRAFRGRIGCGALRPPNGRGMLRPYLALGMACLAVCALLPIYNFIVTGSPFTNTYTLWWPYDTVGFKPQSVGAGAHTILLGVVNVWMDLLAFQTAFTGWPAPLGIPLAVLPLIFGLLLAPRRRADWLLLLPLLALIAAHLAYWARAGDFFGGRYYSEAMPFLWLLSARGLLKFSCGRWRILTVRAALPVFLAWGLLFQILPRFTAGRGLYGVSRETIADSGAAGLHNALVFISIHAWKDLANFSWLNSPFLDTDVIFARDLGADQNGQIIEAFPGRNVFYYTPGGSPAPADD